MLGGRQTRSEREGNSWDSQACLAPTPVRRAHALKGVGPWNFREFRCTPLENTGILSTWAVLLILILRGPRPGEAAGRTLDLPLPSLVSVPTGLLWPKHLGAFRVVSVQPEPGLCFVPGSVKAAVIRSGSGSSHPCWATHTCQASEAVFQGGLGNMRCGTRWRG